VTHRRAHAVRAFADASSRNREAISGIGLRDNKTRRKAGFSFVGRVTTRRRWNNTAGFASLLPPYRAFPLLPYSQQPRIIDA